MRVFVWPLLMAGFIHQSIPSHHRELIPDPRLTPTDAAVVEGSVDLYLTNFPRKFATAGPLLDTGVPKKCRFPGLPNLCAIKLPDGAGANTVRTTIEFLWSGVGIANEEGEDMVIYESGAEKSPEPFAVSVFNNAKGEFSPYRYHFATVFDRDKGKDGAFGTFLDFSDFGIAEGESVARVRIRNLFNSESASGFGDLVDQVSGEGLVYFEGERREDPDELHPFYAGPMALYQVIPKGRLDADIIALAGIRR